MKLLQRKGKRIRPSDKHLVFQFFFAAILSCWLLAFLPFHLSFFSRTTWQLEELEQHFFSPYGSLSLAFSLLSVGVLLYLLYRYGFDYYKSLTHRQKLARMILENGWLETKQVEEFQLFEDSPSKKKEKISYFPKFYYRMNNGLIVITVEITLGKYQDQLLRLEKKLESGLYCELVDKELKDSFVEYTLLYDTIANRLSIEEVSVKNGSMQLMKNIVWAFDSLPHMLIAGGTGGGKTYFILTIIESLLQTNAKLFILDPKNADLADLGTVMENVYYKKEEISTCIDDFYNRMMARSLVMKKMPHYKTGENYAYLGLEPNFLVFDEYVAYMEMLSTKENMAVMNKLKQIVMLGRQAGFFIILACQRPDAKYLQDGIRDQFNFRVSLGRMSELGYSMMFGDVEKDFYLKQIIGRGYVDVGTNVISEFYTPLVPKGHDFLETIGALCHPKALVKKEEFKDGL
ncbi:cell-division FtsK/SpoIIIE-family protein [Enterococcus durans IPLA 655]|uniref:FtsK/SpoIIIE domain-containing protein n=1 Tax=Enterococcus durans TaxID=53345 RepID=UPI00032847A1|nr:FtsK/SpoIIIE domain-containing protein [Enterococcus durans]EMS74341.1 cell-division FtsK/SpoIIIE-family protein [Enterococcus durans IPLA 655]